MSDFDRIEDSLEILKKQEQVFLEEALGIYLDLCQDIKEGGQAIDSLSIGDTGKFLTNLSRSGRIFLNIIRKMRRKSAKLI